MSIQRGIALFLIIVFFSFMHVFLQTEIIKLGYCVKQNEDVLQELLENNRVLHYNIYALESPYRLERYVARNNSDLRHLNSFQVESVVSAPERHYARVQENKQNLFDSPLLLSLRSLLSGNQAEAKTIK